MSAAGTPRIVPLVLHGPAGDLEALLQLREGSGDRLSALVCHPHPLYGGTMHNKVAHRLANVLMDLGARVLRFNFRGAGASAGHHTAGDGELEDARAALAYLRETGPGHKIWVAGFSFGAWIAARLADSERGIERLILVAPPVTRSGFESLVHLPTPKLVIQGTRDDTCPIETLEPEFAKWAGPKDLIRVHGASHFFDKQLGALAEALHQGLDEPARAATSSNG